MFEEINYSMVLLGFCLAVCIGQSFFASILLLASKQWNRSANLYLALSMILLCGLLSLIYIGEYWVIFFPHTISLYLPIIYLIPMLIWAYTTKLADIDIKNGLAIHVIPAGIVVLLLAPFYSLSGIEKLEWLFLSNNQLINISDVQQWASALNFPIKCGAVLAAVFYFYKAIEVLNEHKENIENEFSNTEGVGLTWLRYLIFVYLALYICFIALNSLLLTSNNIVNISLSALVVGTLLISVFGYFGVTQVKIYEKSSRKESANKESYFVNIDLSDSLPFNTGLNQGKYKASQLTSEQVQEIHNDIVNYVRQNKLYLDADLKIGKLADKMQLPSREISRVINESSGRNFMEFINVFRIEEAKKILVGDKGKNVINVAMDSGFNSKSAFYNAFKKMVGTTPVAYRTSYEFDLEE